MGLRPVSLLVRTTYAFVTAAFWLTVIAGGLWTFALLFPLVKDLVIDPGSMTSTWGDAVEVVLAAGTAALAALGFHQLRAILNSVQTGDPFAEANVRRLRVLGALFLTQPLVTFANSYVTSALNDGGLRIDPGLNSVLAGLCLLVLAEVFAHGVRMRTDIEGTI